MTTNETTPAFGDSIESFKGSGKFDLQGREIGFIVGVQDNGVSFYAWVQAARSKKNDAKEFGVIQRSKEFSSQQAACSWAWATANKRIANL
jgi:hypothetical protein